MMMMNRVICLMVVYMMSAYAATSYQVKVVNNVAPCSNGQYSTISLFISPSQYVMKQGDSVVVPSANISTYTGLGIQENGQYCRYGGDESGCYNPDNSGMQLWIKNNNCTDISLNDPFYCGKYPPNAKTMVKVVMSGSFPNCVATLSRLPSAPLCQYSCPAGVTNNTGAATTSSSSPSPSSTGSTTGKIPQGYPKYLGCYIDQQWNRDLSVQITTIQAANMTVTRCVSSCFSSGYKYAGLQYATECRCGNTYGTKGGKAADTDCNMKCQGNSSQICGAGLRNSLYQLQDAAANLEGDSLPSSASIIPSSSSSIMMLIMSSFVVLFGALML
eukprot:TRINITY_DN4992_c0_g1_i1.p1 TRINITY_DN4992_c0_g1~~TRINITY_DN4992_c0_g1_i1.p1  ORF type:complete len:330 (-),score=109.49 TRINITY_DN4992_c0_g1_i1:16-1005(-)